MIVNIFDWVDAGVIENGFIFLLKAIKYELLFEG
jgi:hypothetical protein